MALTNIPVTKTSTGITFNIPANQSGTISLRLNDGQLVVPSYRITGNGSDTVLTVAAIPTSIIPAPANTLWTVTSRLTGAHPRMLLPERPLTSLRMDFALTTAPWALYKVALAESLADTVSNPNPPPTIPPVGYGTSEDPTRALEDNIATLLLQFLLTDSSGDLTVLKTFVNAIISYGVPVKDLPLSIVIRNMSFVLDLAYFSFNVTERANIVQFIIACVRQMRSTAFQDGNSWRQTQFYANHNWFDYTCYTPAAIALWGEPGVDIAEITQWINDAVIDMDIVASSMPLDGLNVEGPLYKAYGEQCYYYQAILESTVLNRNVLLQKNYAIRSPEMIYSMVPFRNSYAPLCFSDAKQFANDILGGSEWFRYINTSLSVAVAQILENNLDVAGATSRKELYPFESFMFAKTNQTPANIATINKDWDYSDTGVYVRRNIPMGTRNETIFAMTCAPYNGFSGHSIWGATHASGHLLPNKGDFTWWASGVSVFHPTEYGTVKLSRNSNVTTFQGQGGNASKPHLGQIGEGGGFFSLGPFFRQPANQPAPPTVIHPADTLEVATWLCQIGSVYSLDNSPNLNYLRRFVFLRSGTCNGVLIIADRIRTAVPYQSKFRLLPCPMHEINRASVLLSSQTAKMIDSAIPDVNGFTWKAYANSAPNGTPLRMGRVNYYGQPATQTVVNDYNVNSYQNSARRNELQWSITGTDVVYAVAIGETPVVTGVGAVSPVNAGTLAGVSVVANTTNVIVTAPTGTFTFGWS
jgi:hypothetical protein